nr:type II secretion system F family protein [bacterium]
MANFSYSVRAAGGRVTTGNLAAESRVDALNTLRNKGLFVLDLIEQDSETSIDRAGFGGGFFQRVKLQDLAVFMRQFAAMVDAGIPLTRCLVTLAKQQKNAYFSKLLLAIKNDIAAGMQPSAAMAKYPRVFNAMVISMMVSAEETGTLDKTLDQLAETFEAEVNLRHQISAGMRYPQIVTVAAFMVVAFVMIFVVPQFQEIFRSMGATLPMMTLIVVGVALFMKRFWWLLVVLFIFMPMILNAINGTPAGRVILDAIKLRIPVFGDLTKKIILARISRVFSTLQH